MLDECSKEIASLLENKQLLFENKHFYIVYASAEQIPLLLPILGRLREEHFRQIGEGTGREIDLDHYDDFYTHIIVWDKRAKNLSASCRIGKIDDLYQKYGMHGIYPYVDFDFDERFIKAIEKNTIILSRLFVNISKQKNFYGLYLIFCGLALWLYRFKKYTSLLGSISISKLLHPALHAILNEYCMTYRLNRELQPLVTARNPLKYQIDPEYIKLLHEEKPANFISLEKFTKEKLHIPDSIPILFKKYDLFKSSYISFSVDDAFSSVTDGLIIADIEHSKSQVMEKFFGSKEIANEFCKE